MKIEIDVTEEEAMMFGAGAVCRCGHLDILHNGHCCEFCTVPGCKCELSGGINSYHVIASVTQRNVAERQAAVVRAANAAEEARVTEQARQRAQESEDQ